MENIRKVSLAAHPITEEEMIKIEKIHGKLLLIGSGIFVKLAFQSAKKYPKECRRAHMDIDHRVRNAVAEWKITEK